MKDRILIDGVWYIREHSDEDLDITEFEGLVYEDTKAVFEATRIKDDNGNFYPDYDIKYTDKREKPWKDDIWDNTTWFTLILKGDEEAVASALEIMDKETFHKLKDFLKYIRDVKKWETR